ncbi:hypothetical protein DXG03_005844 [Asterophora parasitica]|uniref:Uncharacterized protein n=1 Tax=Asterophora parasitica TaxID=117018 RepID=A0A9P7G5M1_9AGAR|nr:hypothetical protein DXG03_005844 [Asterophora parasitica]
MSALSLQPLLTSLLKSLPPGPLHKDALDKLVKEKVVEARKVSHSEIRKSQWEYLLKNEVFKLAITEGKSVKEDANAYYNTLRSMLDVILTFTEHGTSRHYISQHSKPQISPFTPDECEQTFPFIVLQDLLETQTISSCSRVFAWIESRAARLTVDLKPQKGKALILLRSLNDLLRRLSKMGSTTVFCGRILTFLSGVFPLGERSGVNLRGEYGPTWEGVGELGGARKKAKFEKEEKEKADGDAMQVDQEDKEKKAVGQRLVEKKEEFYNTFWGLQLPFSKPPLFATADTFPLFKDAVNRVLPTIKEATAKERAMMGSRTGSAGAASLKRKRELNDGDENNSTEYFFAKFLTSPDLTDLEIADTHFRRQFLFQLLILLNHLLTFTQAAKAEWTAPNNRALQMDFTLEPNDAQWVTETISKATEELRQTTPNGRTFAESVLVVLEREKNWVNWKNHLCAPFDKTPASFQVGDRVGGLFEATKPAREEMREGPEEWPWSHGSEALTEIWEMGCRGLHDVENPFQPGEVKDFIKKIKLEDHRIQTRKRTLAKQAERRAALELAKSAAASPAPTPAPENEERATPVKVQEPSTPRPSDALSAPRPIPAGSPLHPSLPAKPGSSPMKLSSSQEPVKSATPVPAVTVSSAPSAPAPTTAAPAPAQVPTPSPTPAPVEKPDEQILHLEENKHRWAWLALRTARDQYLQLFGKIGTGDIEMLAKEIEKEKERERLAKLDEETAANGPTKNENGNGNGSVEEGIDSPLIKTVAPPPEESTKTEGEDVKMEEVNTK